jgi:hypothetical protein
MKTNLKYYILIISFLMNISLKGQNINNLQRNVVNVPEWSKSVVKIWYECNGNIYSGSGVIISKNGYVITAAHVGKNCNNNNDPKISIGVVSSIFKAPQKQFTAKFVDSMTDSVTNTNEFDLKLLKIDNLNGAEIYPAIFSSILPISGDDIQVAGFPDLPFAYLRQKEAPISIYKTSILSCFAEEDNVPVRLHYGGNSLPGFSGGPIFDKNGKLIGIHSTRTTANINNLLNTNCMDTVSNTPCYGNAVRFTILTEGNKTTTQVVNLDYNALKSVLDNYSWGTSIWRIPQKWIETIKK